jgi:NADP-dependent 3-hydroxy acid dehydrogenase YdfG
MAGLYPLGAALYGATKGAMHRLSTNLRVELQGTGVRVTEICPGRIKTEFYDVAVDDAEVRADILDTGTTEVTAAECADTIVYAVSAAPNININRIELQPTEQTYGGSQFAPRLAPGEHT